MVSIEFDGCRPRIAPTAFIAPTATLIGEVTVEDGASIWFGVVLRADVGPIVVRARASVQDNAVVHTSPGAMMVIEEESCIAHGAILHGCQVRKGALVGMNSVVLDGAVIGEYALVASGTLVPNGMEVPDRHLVAGVPGKIRGPLNGELTAYVETAGPEYYKLCQEYLRQGIGVMGKPLRKRRTR